MPIAPYCPGREGLQGRDAERAISNMALAAGGELEAEVIFPMCKCAPRPCTCLRLRAFELKGNRLQVHELKEHFGG